MGFDIPPRDLSDLADSFENQIYPTDRAFFGSEWTPGVDGDPHIYILYARGLVRISPVTFLLQTNIHPRVNQILQCS